MGHPGPQVPDLQPAQGALHQLGHQGPGQPQVARGEGDVVPHRGADDLVVYALQEGGDARPLLGRQGVRRVTEDLHLPLLGLQQPQHEQQEGALARPVGPQQGRPLPGAQLERGVPVVDLRAVFVAVTQAPYREHRGHDRSGFRDGGREFARPAPEAEAPFEPAGAAAQYGHS